jgi:hypothetical protein
LKTTVARAPEARAWGSSDTQAPASKNADAGRLMKYCPSRTLGKKNAAEQVGVSADVDMKERKQKKCLESDGG